MTYDEFKVWQKNHNLRRVQSNIKLAERALAFWTKVESDRRMSGIATGEALFIYIRKAKQHRKEAQSNLDYWKDQLSKLAA